MGEGRIPQLSGAHLFAEAVAVIAEAVVVAIVGAHLERARLAGVLALAFAHAGLALAVAAAALRAERRLAELTSVERRACDRAGARGGN